MAKHIKMRIRCRQYIKKIFAEKLGAKDPVTKKAPTWEWLMVNTDIAVMEKAFKAHFASSSNIQDVDVAQNLVLHCSRIWKSFESRYDILRYSITNTKSWLVANYDASKVQGFEGPNGNMVLALNIRTEELKNFIHPQVFRKSHSPLSSILV